MESHRFERVEPNRGTSLPGTEVWPDPWRKWEILPSGDPPCGTVGYIAGWTCVLGGVTFAEETDEKHVPWGAVVRHAAELLGFEWSDNANSLFHAAQWPDHNMYIELMGATPGTRKYAAIVARRIDQFIEEQEW